MDTRLIVEAEVLVPVLMVLANTLLKGVPLEPMSNDPEATRMLPAVLIPFAPAVSFRPFTVPNAALIAVAVALVVVMSPFAVMLVALAMAPLVKVTRLSLDCNMLTPVVTAELKSPVTPKILLKREPVAPISSAPGLLVLIATVPVWLSCNVPVLLNTRSDALIVNVCPVFVPLLIALKLTLPTLSAPVVSTAKTLLPLNHMSSSRELTGS